MTKKSQSVIVSEAESTELIRINCGDSENTELEAVKVEIVDDEIFSNTPPTLPKGKHFKNASVIGPSLKHSLIEPSKDTVS